MLNVNKPVQTGDRHQSTNCDRKSNKELNKLDELDEISHSSKERSNQESSSSNEIHHAKVPSQLSKLNRMFRMIGNLKSSKSDKSKRNDKASKFENIKDKRPLITVIHKTVTKNNVKLFTGDPDPDASNKLSMNLTIPIAYHNGDNLSNTTNQSIGHNRSDSSMNHSVHSTDFISKDHFSNEFDETNLSSLPTNPTSSLINRKIEDVRSRSETKLTNCQRKQPAKLKSESFYFLESKNFTVQDQRLKASKLDEDVQAHLNSKLYKKHNRKCSRQQEQLNFQGKKLIAKSLVNSNRNSEMNALLNTSTTDSNRSGSPNLNEPNTTSHKIPVKLGNTYIGISCAIYIPYSKYIESSTYNKFINSSESNSPSNAVRRLNDVSLHTTSLTSNASLLNVPATKAGGQFLDTNPTIESYSSFKNNLNRFNKLGNQPLNTHHLDNKLASHTSNHLNHSHQFDSFDNSFLSKDRTLLNDCSSSRDEEDNKSLVQKRIESLYGHNFASNWKDRLDRSKLRNEKTNNDSFRSPSCPPEFITNGLISSKKNLPVLKYIQNTMFHNNPDDLKKDADKSNKQQTKSEEAISFKNEEHRPSLNGFDSKPVDHGRKADQLNNVVKEVDLLLTDNLLSSNKENEALISNSQDDLLSSNDQLTSIKEHLLIPDKQDEKGIDELDKIDFNQILHNQIEHDGRWYLKKLDDEISKINDKISQVEAICLDENLNNREDIDGKIRSSIGKAHLLINKKLSQFKELCNKNINQTPDEQYKALNEDLEGFYEMVAYQIDDVHKTFDEILFLKNNNWIVHNDLLNPSPRKGSKNSSRANSNANSRNNSKPSSRNQSKEDLRRLKLREAKRKHQNVNQQQTNDDIVIFLPNKNEAKSHDL